MIYHSGTHYLECDGCGALVYAGLTDAELIRFGVEHNRYHTEVC